MIVVVFIINGTHSSAAGYRARAFAERFPPSFDVQLAYRSSNKILSILSLLSFLLRTKPNITYVFDMSYSGVLASCVYKLIRRTKLIIETGDAIYELARSSGSRNFLGLWLTRLLEQMSFRCADAIVVRGTFHKKLLADLSVPVEVIQDGVDTNVFFPSSSEVIRERLKLRGKFTVGLIGSSVWSDKLQICYGWELVEMIRLLKKEEVMGIMIGNGSGIPKLKSLCRQYGINDRILFLGRISFEELPLYLNAMDVCLSTQTNNIAGRVRTTGKLPLYLATGRYILASNVGEASLLLSPDMLIEYNGQKDDAYPGRLAEKVLFLMRNREQLVWVPRM